MSSTRRIPWGRFAAEFAVIVIGVLVALAADAWWDGRRLAEEGRTHLEALRTDAVVGIEAVGAAMAEEEERIRVLGQLLAIPDPSVELVDSIDVWLRIGLWQVASHELYFDAYSDLINAGQLELVQGEEVRRLLVAIQRRLGRFTRDQADASRAQVGYVDPVLLSDFDLARIVPEEGPTSVAPNPEHQALLQRRQIRNLLIAKSGFSRGSYARLRGLESRFQDLIDAIDSSLPD